ncbi:MAG: DNRLRE domain-containing protein [Bacteroidetes bacterium]|nr:DNRLRE domain-containing protein [Bacteroidota bacterium]
MKTKNIYMLFVALLGICHYAIAGVPTTLYVGSSSAQSGSANPTNFAYSTPFFSAINNNGEAVTKYRIQITLSSDAGFASPVWDSGSGGVNMTSTANGVRCPDIFYGGSTLLQPGTNYIWRIKFYGTTWSAWSTESATIGMKTGALTARFYPNADSYIQSSSGQNNNNGSETTIHLQSYAPANGWTGRPIMKFTLPSGTGTISGVTLNIYSLPGGYICGASGGVLNVHQITQTGWTEAGVTWNKYDGTNSWTTAGGDYSSTIINHFTMRGASCNYGTPGWETPIAIVGGDATNPLSLNWGDNANLLIKDSQETGSGANYDYTYFASREYTIDTYKRPYLSVTYTVPIPPATLYVGYPSAQSGSANPTNFAYSTPFFSAINNNGEAVTKYRIQLTLSSDAGFASPIWDSGSVGANMTSTADAARCPDIFYGGSTLLQFGTNYIWRIQFYGSTWGAWSTESATIGMTTGALTARFYTGAGDGCVYRYSSSDWNTTHNTADGEDIDVTNANYIYTGVGKWDGSFRIFRVFLPINTSSLPDAAVISASVLYLYAQGQNYGSPDLDDEAYMTVVQSSQTSPATLVNGDYDACGAINNPTEGINTSDRYLLNQSFTSGYKSFPLNATGKGWISNSGWTLLGFREGHDVTNNAYAGGNETFNRLMISSNEGGINQSPYLSVTYTSPVIPTVISPTVTSITSSSAVLGANVTSDGGAAIITRGTCWGTSASPTTNCVAEGGTTTGVFTHARTGLHSGTFVYYRGYATNIIGTGYSADGNFTTSSPSPAIVDWNNSNVQEITLAEDRSFTFANGKSGGVYSIIIKQDGTGGRTVSWPANVKWDDGIAPTLSTEAYAIGIVRFFYDGTNYFGYAPILNAK